jgi:hypothetical protein
VLQSNVASPVADPSATSGVVRVLVAADVGRPGGDYTNLIIPDGTVETCHALCIQDDQCNAFSFVEAGVQGVDPRCWLKDVVRDPEPRVGSTTAIVRSEGLEWGVNRPGGDYVNYSVSPAHPSACRQACVSDPDCRAFTYIEPNVQSVAARCWLKSRVPTGSVETGRVSGVVR